MYILILHKNANYIYFIVTRMHFFSSMKYYF
jgi:hypothetical protein